MYSLLTFLNHQLTRQGPALYGVMATNVQICSLRDNSPEFADNHSGRIKLAGSRDDINIVWGLSELSFF